MNIRAAFDTGRLTVYLSGELDHHSSREALSEIAELLDAYLPRECVLDLGGMSFMDSSGIALIARTCRRMRDLSGHTRLENAQGQPLRVLKAAGIERLLPLAANR